MIEILNSFNKATLALSALLGIFGLLLFILALWRDRSRGRRRCPSCWFSLEALDDECRTGAICPECGRAFKTSRELYRTRRFKRRAALGIVIVVVAMCIPKIDRDGLLSIVPTPVLAAIGSGAGAEWAQIQMAGGESSGLIAREIERRELQEETDSLAWRAWRWRVHRDLSAPRHVAADDATRAMHQRLRTRTIEFDPETITLEDLADAADITINQLTPAPLRRDHPYRGPVTVAEALTMMAPIDSYPWSTRRYDYVDGAVQLFGDPDESSDIEMKLAIYDLRPLISVIRAQYPSEFLEHESDWSDVTRNPSNDAKWLLSTASQAVVPELTSWMTTDVLFKGTTRSHCEFRSLLDELVRALDPEKNFYGRELVRDARLGWNAICERPITLQPEMTAAECADVLKTQFHLLDDLSPLIVDDWIRSNAEDRPPTESVRTVRDLLELLQRHMYDGLYFAENFFGRVSTCRSIGDSQHVVVAYTVPRKLMRDEPRVYFVPHEEASISDFDGSSNAGWHFENRGLDDLAYMIAEFVEPERWVPLGGDSATIDGFGDRIVVCAPMPIQIEVDELLERMERVAEGETFTNEHCAQTGATAPMQSRLFPRSASLIFQCR